MKTLKNILLWIGGCGCLGVPVLLFVCSKLDLPPMCVIVYFLVLSVVLIVWKILDLTVRD